MDPEQEVKVEEIKTEPVEVKVEEAPPEPKVEEVKAEVKTEPVKKPPFWQKRIDDLTTEKYGLRDKLTQSEQEKAALLSKLTRGEKQAEPLTGDVDQQVTQKAKQIAAADRAAEKFNTGCNKVWEEGKTQFQDWEDINKNLAATGAFDFQQNTSFMQNVIELDNASKVLHHLGSNPDEATRILSLSANRQAMELARLESKLKTPVKTDISAASPPIKPVGGSAKPVFNPDDPDQPMEKWLEWRNKELERRQQARR